MTPIQRILSFPEDPPLPGSPTERNNHGHLLIRELQRLVNLRVLEGYDGRPGWLNTVKGKLLLYSLLANAVQRGTKKVPGPGGTWSTRPRDTLRPTTYSGM